MSTTITITEEQLAALVAKAVADTIAASATPAPVQRKAPVRKARPSLLPDPGPSLAERTVGHWLTDGRIVRVQHKMRGEGTYAVVLGVSLAKTTGNPYLDWTFDRENRVDVEHAQTGVLLDSAKVEEHFAAARKAVAEAKKAGNAPTAESLGKVVGKIVAAHTPRKRTSKAA